MRPPCRFESFHCWLVIIWELPGLRKPSPKFRGVGRFPAFTSWLHRQTRANWSWNHMGLIPARLAYCLIVALYHGATVEELWSSWGKLGPVRIEMLQSSIPVWFQASLPSELDITPHKWCLVQYVLRKDATIKDLSSHILSFFPSGCKLD